MSCIEDIYLGLARGKGGGGNCPQNFGLSNVFEDVYFGLGGRKGQVSAAL